MKKFNAGSFARMSFICMLSSACISSAAWSGETYTLTIKDHHFEPAQVKAPIETPVTLLVKNLDASPEEFESKSLHIEKIIPANSEVSFQLRPLKAGVYKFVGEFHEETAKGEIIVE